MSDSIASRLLSAVKKPQRTPIPSPLVDGPPRPPAPCDTSPTNLRIIPSTIEPSVRPPFTTWPCGRKRSKRLSLDSHDIEAGGAEDPFIQAGLRGPQIYLSLSPPQRYKVYHGHVCNTCSFFTTQGLGVKVFQEGQWLVFTRIY